MSAELPHLGTIWEAPLNRRNFFRLLGAAAGTAALSCLPQSLSQGSSSKENLSQEEYFPPRTKLSEIVRWQEEGPSSLREIEKGSHLFGEAVGKFSDGRLWLEEFLTGRIKEIDPPIALKEIIAFAGPGILSQISPNKEKLAFWLWDNKESLQTDFLVLLDLNSLSIRKVYERNQPVKTFPSVYRWSEDSRRLLCAFRTGWAETEVGIENNEVFIFEDEKLIYSQKGVLGHPGGISPDGEWVLLGTPTTSKNQSNYSLVNLESKKTISLFPIWGEGTLSVLWSPDSQSLVCGGEIFWPRDPQFTKFSLAPALIWVDLKNGTQENKRHLSSFYGLINLLHLSPDRDKILFSAYSDESHRKELLLFNFETGEMKSLVSHEWVGAFSNPDNFFFLSNEELLLVSYDEKSPYLNIQAINLSTGQVNNLYKIKITDSPIFPWWLDSNWLVYSKLSEGLPKETYAFSLKTGKEFLLASLSPNNFNKWLILLNEGQVVQADKRFYFSQGRKYLVTPQASEMLATVAPKPIPARIIGQIPESVNKLEFRDGDLLVVPGKTAWYLRNGRRYSIRDWEQFQRNTRFNQKVREVPDWVVQRVQTVPELTDGGEFIRNWDGQRIEVQKDGGLMILFCAGYGSSTGDAKTTFVKVKERLKRVGWRDTQFLEFTYNVGIKETKVGGQSERIITPSPYVSDLTFRDPVINIGMADALLEYYKKLCLRTKLILIGFSQGGFLAFNAALKHPDLLSAVITINSPLTGVDRVIVPDIAPTGETADLTGLVFGNEAGRFYIAIGENETTRQNTENFAQRILRENNVELFTFSATNDNLVRTRRAFLESSNRQINGHNVQLQWDVPFSSQVLDEIRDLVRSKKSDQVWEALFKTHGALLDYDPFLDELMRVVGRP